MRESADSSTQDQRYHVLTAATFSNGDKRNFVHMKLVVDAGYHLHLRFAKTVCGGGRFPACSREVPSTQERIPPKSSMNGDRKRHGSSALAPSQGGISVPQAYRKSSRCFMMPRTKFVTNTSHELPITYCRQTDEKT